MTVTASFVTLLILPLIIRDSSRLTAVIAHALPFEAWNRLAAVPYPPATAHPWTITGAWTVYAAWALAGTALAVTAVTPRDL
jgi:ABC-2 type transport system permease protein